MAKSGADLLWAIALNFKCALPEYKLVINVKLLDKSLIIDYFMAKVGAQLLF
jgi:hypothetical protein